MTRHHVDQGYLPLPVVERPPPDYEGEARAELNAAMELAKAAVDRPPWDYRKQRFWRVVAPNMSRWLPADERTAFLACFLPELDRIEGLYSNDERETGNG